MGIKPFIFFVCAISAIFLLSFFDLPLESHLYRSGSWSNSFITKFLYNWAPLPSLILSAIAFFWLTFSFFIPNFFIPKTFLLCFLLTMGLGSGVLIHALFKEHWGRARPKQIVQFGGQEEYSAFYMPKKGDKEVKKRSFPCGHASCGFVFFAFSEVYRRKKKYFLSCIWVSIALFLGFALGYARMAAGGHFLSDVLVSALIMYSTAYASAFFLILAEPSFSKNYEKGSIEYIPKIWRKREE